jgi:hypothetical protein
LQFAAGCYLPFLDANDRALAAGEELVRVDVFGGDTSGLPRAQHTQPPFKYQQRCLRLLRGQYDGMQGADRDLVKHVLSSVGLKSLRPRAAGCELAARELRARSGTSTTYEAALVQLTKRH